MASSCAANLRFGTHFECGNVKRWPERASLSTPGYRFNLSFVFIKHGHCIRVLFRQRKCTAVWVFVCAFLKSSLHAWSHRVAAQRRGTDGIIIARQRDFCLAQRSQPVRSPASAQTHTNNILLREALFTRT